MPHVTSRDLSFTRIPDDEAPNNADCGTSCTNMSSRASFLATEADLIDLRRQLADAAR